MPNPIYNLITWGQSNRSGQVFNPPNSSPVGFPLASVRFWPIVGLPGSDQGVNPGTLVDLDVTTPDLGGQPIYWGTELQLGSNLAAQGLDVCIFKTSRSSTTLKSWLPGQPNWSFFFSGNLPDFQAEVDALYPGRDQLWFLLVNQGESEAQAASSTGADAWSADLITLMNGIESLISVTLEAPIITRLNSNLASAPHLATMRTQQAASDPDFIDSDDVPLGAGNVHYTTPAAISTLGAREAARVYQAAPPENTLPSHWLTVR